MRPGDMRSILGLLVASASESFAMDLWCLLQHQTIWCENVLLGHGDTDKTSEFVSICQALKKPSYFRLEGGPVEVREQLLTLSSLLPSCGSLGLNSGHQPWLHLLNSLSHLTSPLPIFVLK